MHLCMILWIGFAGVSWELAASSLELFLVCVILSFVTPFGTSIGGAFWGAWNSFWALHAFHLER